MGTEKSEEQKRGTQEERKSLKNGKEECNRRTEKSPPQAKKQLNCICTKSWDGPEDRRGQEPQDISWASSPIGKASCTECALSHRTGQRTGEDRSHRTSAGRRRL